jgi:hypothetical protein
MSDVYELVVEKETRNIAQRNVFHLFCVTLNDNSTMCYMENFSKPLEMMQCQEHKPFTGTKCFLKAEPLLKISSTVDDHQRHGEVTTQHE